MDDVLNAAIKVYTDGGKPGATLPLRLSPEELGRATPLPSVTRLWLRDAVVTLLPAEQAAVPQNPGRSPSPYYVSVRFPGGVECRATHPRVHLLGLRGVADIAWRCQDPRMEPRMKEYASTYFLPSDVAETMVISQVKPVAPDANSGEKSAVVTLRIFIDVDGVVKWAHPLSGDEPFVSAAVRAVEQWRYQPLRLLGWPAGLAPEPKRRVRAALKGLKDWRGDVRALRGELDGFYRLRVGGFRIVYHLIEGQEIRLDYADTRDVVYEAFRQLRILSEMSK